MLTGRGLEEVKRKIAEAFEQIHHPVARPKMEECGNVTRVELEPRYTEEHHARFQSRSHQLALSALASSHAFKATARSRNGVYDLGCVDEKLSPQELFDQ